MGEPRYDLDYRSCPYTNLYAYHCIRKDSVAGNTLVCARLTKKKKTHPKKKKKQKKKKKTNTKPKKKKQKTKKKQKKKNKNLPSNLTSTATSTALSTSRQHHEHSDSYIVNYFDHLRLLYCPPTSNSDTLHPPRLLRLQRLHLLRLLLQLNYSHTYSHLRHLRRPFPTRHPPPTPPPPPATQTSTPTASLTPTPTATLTINSTGPAASCSFF